MTHLFALCTETKLISVAELYLLCKPLELNARHCAEAHGFEPSAVVPFDHHSRVPDHASPIVFTDDDGDPGALGAHYVDQRRGGPAAVIYVDRASGLNVGSQSVCETVSHEINESDCNPRLNIWRPHPSPDRFGVQIANEVDDPLQDTYEVVVDGMRWQVANFVKPSWFDRAALDPEVRGRILRGGGFDHARRLSGPGEILPGGYAIMRERVDGRWQVWLEDERGDRFASVPTKSAALAKQKALATSRSNLLRATA